MAVKIGGADGGNKFVKKNQYKLKDGDSTFRILPSLGFKGKEPNGRWAEFYRIHFGFRNSKGEMRVFQSPLVKNYKTKMIEAPDAALERIEKLKAELEKAKASGNQAATEKLMELVGSKKAKYNLDSNWHMNVVDEQGNIGILKIRHKAKLALDAVIKTLRSKGIEPLGADSGRFFVFNRTGTGLETTFTVTVKTRTVKVDGYGELQQDVVHALTEDVLNRLETEAGELDNLYKKLSSDEVARIVATSDLMSGKSPAIDELFDTRNNNSKAPEPQLSSAEEPGDEDDGPAQTQTQATTQTTTAAQPTPAPTQTTQAAPSAASVTVGTPAPTTQTLAPPATKTTAQAVNEQTDEAFLKSLGL